MADFNSLAATLLYVPGCWAGAGKTMLFILLSVYNGFLHVMTAGVNEEHFLGRVRADAPDGRAEAPNMRIGKDKVSHLLLLLVLISSLFCILLIL
jgi:hypothetical protein